MENGDAAERSARPLGKIGVKFWMECLNKGTRERNLESRANNGTLSVEVHDWKGEHRSAQRSTAWKWGLTLVIDHQSEQEGHDILPSRPFRRNAGKDGLQRPWATP